MVDVVGRGRLTDHVSIGILTRVVPRFVVDEAVALSGRKEKRSRLLPAHFVVYFVLALSLFTESYEEIVRKLVQGLRFMRVWSTAWSVPSTGALSQARIRLGVEPLRIIFENVAQPLAGVTTAGAWLGHFRLMALDGVMLDMPDTPENAAAFNKPEGGTRRPFPQARIVGLVEIGTHATVDIEIGSIRTGERELSKALIRKVDPDMLVVADRGFYSFDLWKHYAVTGAELLWRAWSTLRLPVLDVLPDGSYISEITNQERGSKTRINAHDIDDINLATHIRIRVVEYRVSDGGKMSETFRLMTTITDHGVASAAALADAYHQRWEIESAFREIEVYQRQNGGLRSKKPDLVRQEIYGLFTTHYAIRSFMVEAADSIDIDPDRISFTRTLRIVRRRIADPADFSP